MDFYCATQVVSFKFFLRNNVAWSYKKKLDFPRENKFVLKGADFAFKISGCLYQ